MTPVRQVAGLALLGLAALAAAPADEAPAGGPPLDAVRQVLRERAMPPPPEALLQALAPAETAEGLRRIDPYTRLFSPQAYAAERTAGSDGIGAELYPRDGRLWLLPFAHGPLARVGVTERVELLAVDGRPVAGWTPEAVAALFAEGGAVYALEVCAPGCSEPRVVTVTAEAFTPASVEWVRDGDETHIRIRRFVARETRAFLLAAVRQLGGDAPVTLDLRDAGGGDLFEALDCAALFLPQGTPLARTVAREDMREYVAGGGEKLPGPVRVLIGSDTASAAEVFAGALQANGAATLVGEPSRGKCESQTDAVLPGGWVLRFTNLRVYTPGRDACRPLTPESSAGATERGEHGVISLPDGSEGD